MPAIKNQTIAPQMRVHNQENEPQSALPDYSWNSVGFLPLHIQGLEDVDQDGKLEA